jgi:hypothetical protein
VKALLRRPFIAAVIFCLGCGGSDDPSGPETDGSSPAGFMVGSWIASSLVLTNKANPEQSDDIVVQFDAVFTLGVQESGRYLAILSGFGQSSSESGRLTVSGGILTMRRELPSPSTSVSEISQQGTDVVIDGDTDFDFNQDGILEPSVLHMVLTPQQ